MVFASFEEGNLALSEYLKRVVFYKERAFTQEHFRDCMFAQTVANTSMIDPVIKRKEKYHLKIAAGNNEAGELNEYRIQRCKLNRLVDMFISSCYVHLRKPDADIFRLALHIAQVQAQWVVYIKDASLFTAVAIDVWIGVIQHKNHSSTFKALANFRLKI